MPYRENAFKEELPTKKTWTMPENITERLALLVAGLWAIGLMILFPGAVWSSYLDKGQPEPWLLHLMGYLMVGSFSLSLIPLFCLLCIFLRFCYLVVIGKQEL